MRNGMGIKTFPMKELLLAQSYHHLSPPLTLGDQVVRLPRLLKGWLREVFHRFSHDGLSYLSSIKEYLRHHDTNFLLDEEKNIFIENGLFAIPNEFVWVTFDELMALLLRQVCSNVRFESQRIFPLITEKRNTHEFSRAIPSTLELIPSFITLKLKTTVQERIASVKQYESELPKVDGSVIDRIDRLMREDRGNRVKADDSDDDMEVSNSDPKLTCRKRNLSRDEESLVDDALSFPHTEEVLIEKFKIPMTRAKINCLRPSAWLNDEVINFYMEMLAERDLQLCSIPNSNRKPSHFFSSFFISKLLENGAYRYENVRRWTKKFDIFSKLKVFFPINISNTHWTLAVAFVQEKKVVYYDSMGGTGERYTEALVSYFLREGEEKQGIVMVRSEWKTEAACKVMSLPQQKNGVDCGMFTIMYADFLSDDLDLREFGQEDIPAYRRKTVAAILRGRLDYDLCCDE